MAISEELKYRALIETAPDPIFLVDMETGRLVEVNERAERLLGYEADEIEGDPVARLHPGEDREAYLARFEETIDRESVHFSTLPDGSQAYLRTADGDRIPVDVSARMVEVEGSRYVVSIARDISTLKEHEREIERLAEELAVVNRIVRHDIRNDMTVVRAWLDELDRRLDDHGEILDRLERRCESVVELTDTVKDYVDLLDEEAEIRLEPIPLASTVEDEVRAVEEAYSEPTVTVGDLPDVEVLANGMLPSVFRNLLHNAVQHNDADDPRITVTAEEGDGTVAVQVADNGPGVPEDRRDEIFGKGDRRLESSGTGIGLYLVGTLVEGYGGEVRIGDNEPRGTVFTVELRTV